MCLNDDSSTISTPTNTHQSINILHSEFTQNVEFVCKNPAKKKNFSRTKNMTQRKMNVKMPKLGANSGSFPKLLTILPQNNIATIRLSKF